MRYILVHDLGTSGNKATLFNTEGEIINSEVNCRNQVLVILLIGLGEHGDTRLELSKELISRLGSFSDLIVKLLLELRD